MTIHKLKLAVFTGVALAACQSMAFDRYVWKMSPLPPQSPYTNWNTASHCIQPAVDIANPGETVYVREGTYDAFGGMAVGSNVALVCKAIRLTAAAPVEQTIINGRGARRCVYLCTNATLRGFTLTNGCPGHGAFMGGGGLYCAGAGTVEDCVIAGNLTVRGDGGGVYCKGGPTLTECLITGNRATGNWSFAGGVYDADGGATLLDCTITLNWNESLGGIYCRAGTLVSNCLLSENHGIGGGGAVQCAHGGTLIDCKLYDNIGGGATLYEGGELLNCELKRNLAAWSGGAVYCYNGGLVSNCLIAGNYATNLGGGCYVLYTGNIVDTTFQTNAAEYGGGVCYFGRSWSEPDPVRRCVFVGNSARYGGGAYCTNAGSFHRSMFIDNTAEEKGGGVYCRFGGAVRNSLVVGNVASNEGGGMYLEGGGDIYNCTLSDNAADFGGGVYCDNGGELQNVISYFNSFGGNRYNVGSNITYRYCCTTPGVSGDGNITDDPLFENVGAGNFRLNVDSPCIDAGENMLWMADAEDLDGNPRIYDGTVDMGCYEFIPEPGLFIIYRLAIVICWRKFLFSERNL